MNMKKIRYVAIINLGMIGLLIFPNLSMASVGGNLRYIVAAKIENRRLEGKGMTWLLPYTPEEGGEKFPRLKDMLSQSEVLAKFQDPERRQEMKERLENLGNFTATVLEVTDAGKTFKEKSENLREQWEILKTGFQERRENNNASSTTAGLLSRARQNK